MVNQNNGAWCRSGDGCLWERRGALLKAIDAMDGTILEERAMEAEDRQRPLWAADGTGAGGTWGDGSDLGGTAGDAPLFNRAEETA